jgi:hypothetical protein
VKGDPDLLQVVGALDSPRRLACRLHGGEEQRDEHADDRDNDQELNQREAASTNRRGRSR